MKQRIEQDSIGSKEIDNTLYYGIQTQRALENFDISSIPIYTHKNFILAMIKLKKAIALTNQELGIINKEKSLAIIDACNTIIKSNELHKQFPLDVIQGGAGTSSNMNANEVIANLALEKIGKSKGMYDIINPNDDINMSQSTNDFYPSSIKLAILMDSQKIINSAKLLIKEFQTKAKEFHDVLKIARTEMQDAVPITFGMVFNNYSNQLIDSLDSFIKSIDHMQVINIGGTAVGTGINTHKNYVPTVEKKIQEEFNNKNISIAKDLVQSTQDATSFMEVTNALKRIATQLNKIASDIILISSGPHSGLGEINIPPKQPGSSIMPGKINPVIPEVVRSSSFQVIGLSYASELCMQNGQLELNAFEPLILHNTLTSIKILSNSMSSFANNCINGITINQKINNENINKSISLLTPLIKIIGYKKTSEVAQNSLNNNISVLESALEITNIPKEELAELLKAENMLKPHLNKEHIKC